jgi:hypothetical protein
MALASAVWTVTALPASEPPLEPALAVREMQEIGCARLFSVSGSQRDVDIAVTLLGDLDGIVLGDCSPKAGARHASG